MYLIKIGMSKFEEFDRPPLLQFESKYRWSTAGRAISAREIEIKWFGQVFSELA